MRRWIIVDCLFFRSCGDEPLEKSVTPTGSDNAAGNSTSKALDTSSGFAKDTASHASFTVLEIKKPSGILFLTLAAVHRIAAPGGAEKRPARRANLAARVAISLTAARDPAANPSPGWSGTSCHRRRVWRDHQSRWRCSHADG